MSEPQRTEGTTRRLPVIEKATEKAAERAADRAAEQPDERAGDPVDATVIDKAAGRDPDQSASASAYHPPPAPDGEKGENGGGKAAVGHDGFSDSMPAKGTASREPCPTEAETKMNADFRRCSAYGRMTLLDRSAKVAHAAHASVAGLLSRKP